MINDFNHDDKICINEYIRDTTNIASNKMSKKEKKQKSAVVIKHSCTRRQNTRKRMSERGKRDIHVIE